MKSDSQINFEASEDLEKLKNGRAHYSTPRQDVVVLLAALAEVLLIGVGCLVAGKMTVPEVLFQAAQRCDEYAQDRSLSIRERLEMLLRAATYRAEAGRLQHPVEVHNPLDEMVVAGYDAAGVWHEFEEHNV